MPAFSQSSSDSDKDMYRGKRDRLEQLLGELDAHGSRRGFGFLLRSGDSTVAVKCDPNETMKACVEATTTLLEKARSIMATPK
jgi:hypothetical protein